MKHLFKTLLSGTAVTLTLSNPALATETQKFTYDEKGRLIKIERSGTVNNGVKTEYEHDKANNRKKLKVTGSSNPPPP